MSPYITVARVCLVYHYAIGRTNLSVLSCLGHSLSSLAGKMDSKEREREEN